MRVKKVFPKGSVLFSALEVVSSDIIEKTPNVIASAPATGDMGIIILALAIFLSGCVFASIKCVLIDKHK